MSNVVLWFTGLSGSGKTTLAEAFAKVLTESGKTVVIIDGDDVRDKRKKPLGFSREDIRENNRLIAELAREKKKEHDIVLVPVISPYAEDREQNRTIVGDGYIEVFVDCPLGVCIGKDVKGLYKKALAGEIENFIGVSPTTPYEPPEVPDIILKTGELSVEESVEIIIKFLENKNLV